MDCHRPRADRDLRRIVRAIRARLAGEPPLIACFQRVRLSRKGGRRFAPWPCAGLSATMRSSSGGIMRKGKATSLEVAHLAGVSQPTVSRALRGSPTVNEETRRRIQAIADELNYKVDRNASKLRTQHTDTLALLFFEDPTLDDSLINPFFLSMLGSITRACALHGYDLLISFQQLSGNWLADYQDSKKADGIILLGYGDYIEYLAKLEQLITQGTRFVRWGAVLPGQPGISIGCDNHEGGRSITRHLLDLGRRRIAFLG